MLVEVRLVFTDDTEKSVWAYAHSETVPFTGDEEQSALLALGAITKHAKIGADKIAAEAKGDLEAMEKKKGKRR